jgi:23S rRNA pseudouridine2605 synthase
VTLQRVQKILARAGLGSRRACEELIRQGRVTVNEQVAQLGTRADPEVDLLAVDGERVQASGAFTYVALYKPRGVVSTAVRQTQERRPSVRELVPLPGHLYPVGRLDVESEGLVLLTDDGELTNRLTHPRYGHTKTYRVLVAGRPTEEALSAWRRGIVLEGTRTSPCQVRVLRAEKNHTWLKVVMRQGRKRQIRRLADALGHPVRRLIRTHIGPLALGKLEPGEWRKLSREEVNALRGAKEHKKR